MLMGLTNLYRGSSGADAREPVLPLLFSPQVTNMSNMMADIASGNRSMGVLASPVNVALTVVFGIR